MPSDPDTTQRNIVLNCLDGQPAPAVVIEGWKAFCGFPGSSRESFWFMLAPVLMDPDSTAHGELARKVDAAIGNRDLDALKASFNELSNFHRERMQRTFDAFEAAQLPASLEVSAS